MMNNLERTAIEGDLFYEELPEDYQQIIEEDFKLASIESYNLSKELEKTKIQLAEFKQKYEEKDRYIKTILHSLKHNIETKKSLLECITEMKTMAEKICSAANEVLPKYRRPPIDSYLQLKRESHDWCEPKRPFSAIIQNKNKQNEENSTYYSPMKGLDILTQWEKMCDEVKKQNDIDFIQSDCKYLSNVNTIPLHNDDSYFECEHDIPRPPQREINRSYYNDDEMSFYRNNDFERCSELYPEHNA
jgi:hypothetical protein